jgi:N-acetylmuramoyl-L-alanine amidase
VNDTDRDVLIVATTAFCEASGEGAEGIRAVCWSIVNRHRAGKWFSGKTLAGCCIIASQFSSWNTGDPNRRRALETPLSDPIMSLCVKEAEDAIAGASEDPTHGATHYFNPNAVSAIPAWAVDGSGAQITGRIGNHVFLKNVA